MSPPPGRNPVILNIHRESGNLPIDFPRIRHQLFANVSVNQASTNWPDAPKEIEGIHHEPMQISKREPAFAAQIEKTQNVNIHRIVNLEKRRRLCR